MAEVAETAVVNLVEPEFDPVLGQYVAVTLTGWDVFGWTWGECFDKLTDANECAIDHAVHNDPMGLECALGPCAECGPLVRGKCDWEGYFQTEKENVR